MKALLLRGLFLLAVALGLGATVRPAFSQNIEVNPLLASAARTAATVSSADQTNPQWHSVQVIINVSAYTSGSYTPTIQGKDPVSGNYYTLLTGAALSGTGTTVLSVGPGVTAATNTAAGLYLPRTWRITFAGAATPSMTFSVGAVLE